MPNGTTIEAAVVVRYRDGLGNLPPGGEGAGLHTSLLSVANLGRLAGFAPERVIADLVKNVHGSRRVPESEIRDAVEKAYSTEMPPPRSRVQIDPNALQNIIARGEGATLKGLEEISPVRLDWDVARDHVELLRRLYAPSERLFIGERHDAGAQCVQMVSEWTRRLESGYNVPPHIIPNPLTGRQALKKDGEPSFRADACVVSFRFVTIEFDKLSIEDQCRFFAGAKLPIVALIHSGSKSIHGWARFDIPDAETWTREIEGTLFDILTPLGADPTCKNEARLSRLPGHYRTEKQSWQRVIYLNPDGGPILP